MLCDWTAHAQPHWHTHTNKLHAIGQVHCVAIKWEPQRALSVASFQPRCRLSDHFSGFLVQPLCYLAFIAAWRRHSVALEAQLLERAEYKRAESSYWKKKQAQFPCCRLHHCHRLSGLSPVHPPPDSVCLPSSVTSASFLSVKSGRQLRQ